MSTSGGFWFRKLRALLLLTVLPLGQTALAGEPLFPFALSGDAVSNVTDLADWLKQPAGSRARSVHS